MSDHVHNRIAAKGNQNVDSFAPGSSNAMISGVSPTLKLTAAEIAITLALVGQNRFLASMIGPAGFGVYGLLQSLFRLVSSFATSWMSVPITKWIAEYDAGSDSKAKTRLYSLSLSTAALILIPASIIFAVFHRPIIEYVLGGQVATHHYFIFIGFAFLTAVRTVQSAVLQGLLLIGQIMLIRIVSAFVQVVLVLVLVLQFGLTGMFIGLTISLATAALMTFSVIHRNAQIGFTRPTIRSEEAKNLAKFGGANLVLLVVALTTEYTQRLIVLNGIGIESVGLMVAALQIVVYMDVFNRSAVFYWFAKMSKNTAPEDLLDDYSGFSRLVLIAGIPVVAGGVLFGGTIVDLLLGPNFSTLTSTLYLFISWQFINLVHNPPAMAVMAMAKIKVHAVSTLISALSVPIVMYLGINRWDLGFESVGIALIVGAILAYLPRVMYLGFKLNMWVTKSTWALTVLGALILVGTIFARNSQLEARITIFVLVLVGLLLVTPSEERNAIARGVFKPFSRF